MKPAAVKVYRELEVKGHPDTLRSIIASMAHRLHSGWSRDREAELALREASPSAMYCFACAQSATLPPSRLWLVLEQSGTLYVSNIVPLRQSQLSYDEYNDVLMDFYQTLVAPAAADLDVIVHITDAERDIASWLGEEAAALLRQFALTANKSTGTAHPNDRRRWDAFLVAAHRNRVPLDTTILKRWLVECEGWPDQVASDLALEYESGRSLLEYYDHAGTLVAS